MNPNSSTVHTNVEARHLSGFSTETYLQGLLAMNTEKNWFIQARRPGICSAFPLGLSKDCAEKEFFLLCPVLGLSEYLSQHLRNTPTIIPIAQDQSLLILTGVANV